VQTTVASPQQLAALLNRLSNQINRTASPDMFRAFGELELSFTQVKALFLLADNGELTVKELAARLSLSDAAMSRAVDGLVQRDFVARRECERDRRLREIALLPQGRQVLDRVTAVREAALAEFVAGLTEADRAALHAALLPIVERISTP
jgi:DNA-binding MarR family transcriptional regulator